MLENNADMIGNKKDIQVNTNTHGMAMFGQRSVRAGLLSKHVLGESKLQT